MISEQPASIWTYRCINESYEHQTWKNDTTNGYKACTQKDRHMNAHVCNVILIWMLLRLLVSAEVTVSSHKYLQNEMTCCLKQGLETNITKERFEYQIWWSDTTSWYIACTQKTDINMNMWFMYECNEAVGLCWSKFVVTQISKWNDMWFKARWWGF